MEPTTLIIPAQLKPDWVLFVEYAFVNIDRSSCTPDQLTLMALISRSIK